MDKVFSVLEVIMPVFAAIFLGVLARRKEMLTPVQNQGLQNFVVTFGLPCTLYNSCVTASIGSGEVMLMVLVFLVTLVNTVLAFYMRKRKYPYHNLPMLFAAQESGMLGIPLYMTLFGAAEVYRMGVLNLGQTLVCIPTIAILTAQAGTNPSPTQIIKEVFKSPLMIACLLGLGLNLSGLAAWLDSTGIGGVITATTGFVAEPVSAVILFTIGYNFSLAAENRKPIFQISVWHFVQLIVTCGVMMLVLKLMGMLDGLTFWAVVLYAVLPSSFLAPGTGRSDEDYTVASGVCSILTAVCLVVFCVITVLVA